MPQINLALIKNVKLLLRAYTVTQGFLNPQLIDLARFAYPAMSLSHFQVFVFSLLTCLWDI